MQKIDLKKQLSEFYKVPLNKIVIVEVPKFQYLAIDGKGDPNNSKEFNEAIEALYSLSYTLKFMVKKAETGVDYGVMPLEGQWYMDDMSNFSKEKKEDWKWTLMILQPDFITKEMVLDATNEVMSKKQLPGLSNISFEFFKDGLAAQILHIGPYDDETPTILKLHQFIKDNGYELTGKHREIYLNDARKTAPEKLKTIIRQPIIKSAKVKISK